MKNRPAFLGFDVGLAAALALLSAACGPSVDDFPLLRPDAGPPDPGALEPEPTVPENILESDPLEDWDTTDAGPLSGIFAVEAVVRARAIVELESRQLFRVRLLQKGSEVRMRAQMCRLRLPAVEDLATLSVPIALEMLIRSKDVEAVGPFLSAEEPVGATFTSPRMGVLLGAALEDPELDPLPATADAATALDEDHDGHPGVTLLADVLFCEHREEAYAALRSAMSMTGKVVSIDRIEGELEASLDQSVLGFSDACLSAAANLAVEVLPGSTFQAQRADASLDIDDNGNVTCGEIVVAAPALFGPAWAQ